MCRSLARFSATFATLFCDTASQPITYVNSALHTCIGPNTVYDPQFFSWTPEITVTKQSSASITAHCARLQQRHNVSQPLSRSSSIVDKHLIADPFTTPAKTNRGMPRRTGGRQTGKATARRDPGGGNRLNRPVLFMMGGRWHISCGIPRSPPPGRNPPCCKKCANAGRGCGLRC